MRLRSLATSRELTLATLVVLLLGLTGSASALPGDPETAQLLPQLPSTSAPPASSSDPTSTASRTAPPRPTTAPRPGAATRPTPRAGDLRIPIVDAAPRRPVKVDTKVFPASLESRDLDLSLPVEPVGVTDDGEMDLPDTVARVGWYRFGPYPAAPAGTTVLAAHVDTRDEGLGPFARLQEAKKGDEVTVLDRAGRRHQYRVAGVTSQAKKKIDWNQVFDRRGHTRLVLITCGGAYDQGSGYQDNVLVTAFPLS